MKLSRKTTFFFEEFSPIDFVKAFNTSFFDDWQTRIEQKEAEIDRYITKNILAGKLSLCDAKQMCDVAEIDFEVELLCEYLRLIIDVQEEYTLQEIAVIVKLVS